MAAAIVKPLEVIDIHKYQRNRLAAPLRRLDGPLQGFIQITACCQPGQCIRAQLAIAHGNRFLQGPGIFFRAVFHCLDFRDQTEDIGFKHQGDVKVDQLVQCQQCSLQLQTGLHGVVKVLHQQPVQQIHRRQIEFGLYPNTLVDQPDSQTVIRVFQVIGAGKQIHDITALGGLQALKRVGIPDQ